jgi:hypothetical protein
MQPNQIRLDDEFQWDPEALASDLLLLESIRWSRLAFSELACSESGSKDAKVLAQLRTEPIYQLAEFYFSLKAFGIVEAEHLDRFADLHNDYIVALTQDKAKLARLGLTEDRALAAMFTADTRPRLVQNWRERKGAIDQSNLARFLVAVMSTETCRKAVIDCEAAGLLSRERTPYGTILVISSGRIETIFGQCLRELRKRIALNI